MIAGDLNKTLFVKDLKEKESVSSIFLIKFSAVASGKNGKPYMNLVFMDKTGEVEGRLWEEVPQYMGQVVRNAFVWVEGRCQSYQNRKQIVVNRMQVLREDEVHPKDYIPEGMADPEVLYPQLVEMIHSFKDPHYRALAESIFIDDAEVVDRLKRAPAAKTVHHAYPGGLLEHVVSISKTLQFLAELYGKWVDRDLMLLGGFLHDIGKIWELNYDRVIDYSDAGKLIGHLIMGTELVDRKIQELNRQEKHYEGTFPEEKKLLIKHLILAHHGELEFGSPKRPKCLEAVIVHMVDDLDSKVNSIRSFIEQDQTPGSWTALSRQYERFFYKSEHMLLEKLKKS